MAKLLSLVLVFFCLSIPSISFVDASSKNVFDYFMLNVQWPGTVCRGTSECCESNGCCRSPAKEEFVIYGLYTDFEDGSYPSCCSQSNFDPNEIENLVPTLENYWPPLFCGTSSLCNGGQGSFWAHEYELHGTCASPVINDEYSYFSTAIQLYTKHNVTKFLSNGGISAGSGKMYPLKKVAAAIKNSFGASPLLICDNGAISQVRLCFDKEFEPRDCSGFTSSCPAYVTLPTYAPYGIKEVTGAMA